MFLVDYNVLPCVIFIISWVSLQKCFSCLPQILNCEMYYVFKLWVNRRISLHVWLIVFIIFVLISLHLPLSGLLQNTFSEILFLNCKFISMMYFNWVNLITTLSTWLWKKNDTWSVVIGFLFEGSVKVQFQLNIDDFLTFRLPFMKDVAPCDFSPCNKQEFWWICWIVHIFLKGT